jgi:hypothetical protein
VCDYSQPPVGVQPSLPWLTYQDESGDVIYGGIPLPPAPVGVSSGWVSDAFYLPEPGRGPLLGAGAAMLALLARRVRRATRV